MNVQEPLSRRDAAAAVAHCAVTTAGLLARRQTHLPKEHLGQRLCFADGTSGRVFRETVVELERTPDDPCVLVVEFRLHLLRGRWHAIFRGECILNTPLFVGFPGFVSKLWLDRDQEDRYRGFYQWNDPAGAEHYARSLWRVLELVCPSRSIHYMVLPDLQRDEVLQKPELMSHGSPSAAEAGEWWRLVEVR